MEVQERGEYTLWLREQEDAQQVTVERLEMLLDLEEGHYLVTFKEEVTIVH